MPLAHALVLNAHPHNSHIHNVRLWPQYYLCYEDDDYRRTSSSSSWPSICGRMANESNYIVRTLNKCLRCQWTDKIKKKMSACINDIHHFGIANIHSFIHSSAHAFLLGYFRTISRLHVFLSDFSEIFIPHFVVILYFM